MKESTATFELLPIEEYAKRFGVDRTTIFKWKKQGLLLPKRHYILVGKVLRFLWDLDVIREIHELNMKANEDAVRQSKKSENTQKGSSERSVINLDY